MVLRNMAWTVILSFLLGLNLPEPAAAASGPGRAAGHPVLKPLSPIEDHYLEADAAELFDQAVETYGKGQMSEAEKLFEKVLLFDPKNADAHFNLGAIKEWRKDFRGALYHYKAAALIKSADPEIKSAVVSVEAKLKNQDRAQGEAARYKRDEAIAVFGTQAKEAFAAGNYALAVAYLTRLVQLSPDDPKVQFALGQSLRAMKIFDWSAYRLKMAIFLDPENSLYRKTLADLDGEIQDVQDRAYSESGQLAAGRVKPLAFPEATQSCF